MGYFVEHIHGVSDSNVVRKVGYGYWKGPRTIMSNASAGIPPIGPLGDNRAGHRSDRYDRGYWGGRRAAHTEFWGRPSLGWSSYHSRWRFCSLGVGKMGNAGAGGCAW